MDSRRDFLKKAAVMSAGFSGLQSIQKAFAIDPLPGTTYLDAEHVVILMQENRSFDHAYGTLQGVRGFDDPRAIQLPDGNKVWLQTNAKGETYGPFRLNIKDTKATWMSSLPHSWENQVDARNNGRMDGWLEAKKSGNQAYADMPLTMGYYNREDLPFYYALADAFTVCDQNFCSSLTGTTPNRLYLWTGTIRDPRQEGAMANVRNENVDYDREVSWTTFPERLEDNGISWRIYQNEISLDTGLHGDAEAWLGNFTDNPIEWFSQYRVRFHPAFYSFIQKEIHVLPGKIKATEDKLAGMKPGDPDYAKTERRLREQKQFLEEIPKDLAEYTPEKFRELSQRDKNLHQKAFTTNTGDKDYRTLDTRTYSDDGKTRTMSLPKGDVLHQFRQDVQNKQLPTVSWVVAPENFSDHPGAPWYGAWFLSEMIDILTRNPEVWKKTIFILCYDENDGYFDHVPPFVPAHPDQPETGKNAMNAVNEFVTKEQEDKRPNKGRTGPIGLGFRVPLVIASPWSRGGYVNSEVFDHTSILQFLEKFLSHKKGKAITETNISEWRRTVCGDLTSAFRPYHGEKLKLPEFVRKEPFYESIHKAQFKDVPTGYRKVSKEELADIRRSAKPSPERNRQEKGTRASCALPYELYADGEVLDGRLHLRLGAGKNLPGAVGAPFQVYDQSGETRVRTYTLNAGDRLVEELPAGLYRVYGPNGFFREFNGGLPDLEVRCEYESKGKVFTGNVVLMLRNRSQKPVSLEIRDESYGKTAQTKTLPGGGTLSVVVDLKGSHRWYDFSVRIKGRDDAFYRYAGRVETGKDGLTDPLIGRG